VKLRCCINCLPVPNDGEDARVAEARDTGRDDEAVRRFVERFALDLVEAGMARMPARVFAALLADDDGQLTAAELAERLHVSPAAISGAVRYLMQVSMVARGREPGERRDHYRVSSETWYEAVTRRDQILARWMDDLQQGIKAVGLDTPAGARLEETREFFEFLHDEVPKVMVRWREQHSAGQSG
jgi:DNA-binding transcriptional regulator GbsR (MarR family)